MSKKRNPSRITEFDGLRGLLAWWVVIGHVASAFGDVWVDLIGNHYAVHTFIILSGFVITYLIDTNKEPYLAYIARRWFRLYPVYVPLLLLSAAVAPLAAMGMQASPFLQGNIEIEATLMLFKIQAMDFWRHMGAHLLLLHGAIPISVMPQAEATFLPPSWSLSLEWQYYLVAPFIVWAAASARRWVFLFLFIVLMVVGSFAPSYKITTGFLPIMAWYFAVGIASYYAWKKSYDEDFRFGLLCFCLLAAIDQTIRGEIGTLIWIPVFLSICYALPLRLDAAIRWVLNRPFLQLLGRQSYPVYIGHMAVFYLAFFVVMPLAGNPLLWGVGIVLFTLAGTALVAALMHKYVEVPCMKFGKRITERI